MHFECAICRLVIRHVWTEGGRDRGVFRYQVGRWGTNSGGGRQKFDPHSQVVKNAKKTADFRLSFSLFFHPFFQISDFFQKNMGRGCEDPLFWVRLLVGRSLWTRKERVEIRVKIELASVYLFIPLYLSRILKFSVDYAKYDLLWCSGLIVFFMFIESICKTVIREVFLTLHFPHSDSVII